MTNTGKIQEWSIQVIDGDVPYYEVTFGQTDGKKTTTRTTFKTGKNVGRANETTPLEQCRLEARALWTKKKERSGYTESVPENKPLLPMLAKEYGKDGKHIVFPCYTQPKLDGLRCIYRDGKLMSRQNKEFKTLPHINKSLASCDLLLDGELYSEELTFQEIVSIVKRDEIHPDHEKISYHIYDIVDESADFCDRLAKLGSFRAEHIVHVETNLAHSDDDVTGHFNLAIQQGYEGLMLRNIKGGYKVNGRSKDLQKLKEFIDQEFLIVDIVDGKGKFEGCGMYVCQHKDQTFPVTPKCSEEKKREIFANKNDYIGKMLTVKFFEWTTSTDPLPRFPVGIEVRDYE